MGKKKTSLGSSFDDFLDEQGIYEEATLEATKRILALQIIQQMEKQNISKTKMDLLFTMYFV